MIRPPPSSPLSPPPPPSRFVPPPPPPHRGTRRKFNLFGLSAGRAKPHLAPVEVVDHIVRMPVHSRTVAFRQAHLQQPHSFVLEQGRVDVGGYLHRVCGHHYLLGVSGLDRRSSLSGKVWHAADQIAGAMSFPTSVSL